MAIENVVAFVIFFISLTQFAHADRFSNFEKTYVRKLGPVELNPGGNNTQYTASEGSLTHMVATGEKDELHHIFCTIGAPTLMISRTQLGAKILVDYDKLHSNDQTEAVNFTKIPDHSFGMIFSSLYEFDDFNDTANMTIYKGNSSANTRYQLTELNWEDPVFNHSESDGGKWLTAVFNATGASDNTSFLFGKNGTSYLSFGIRYNSKDGRLESRPHMEHTANSSMVSLVLSNLTVNGKYQGSRFAVEMIMFSTEKNTIEEDDSTQVDLVQSQDDEYSPGVFQMRNWLANKTKKRDEAWGYAQWKPVVYTQTRRKNADLRKAVSYPNLAENRTTILDNHMPERSLFNGYFGADYSEVSLNATHVSFGSSKDKFFIGTNYTVWTMGVGMGPAPEDDVSLLVILVIAVGLGIPIIFMVGTTVFVCMRTRRKNMSSQYTAING